MSAAPPLPEAEKFKIALYRDELDTLPAQVSLTWERFIEFVVDYVQESPCSVVEGPEKCVGPKCPYKKHSASGDPGDYMAWSPVEIDGRRLDKNVSALTLLVLDFDHLDAVTEARVARALAPYEHVEHTTHSNREDDRCVRQILALSRPVPAGQWHRFLAAAVAFLGATVQDRRGESQPDPTCKNRSRLYYRPSHPCGAPHMAQRVRGRALDVDEVLRWSESLPVADVPVGDHEASVEVSDWDLDGDDVAAAIDLMGRYFPDRRRNELCLALAGMLRRAGASLDDARYIVYEVCMQGGSSEPDKRALTVDHTYGLSDESWMTGLTRVSEILSGHVGAQEAEAIAKEFGDHLFLARNEALLRGFSTSSLSSPLAASVIAHVDLAELRRAVVDLAAQRGRALERQQRIDAVILRRLTSGEALAHPAGIGDVETVPDGEVNGVGRERAILKVVWMIAYLAPDKSVWPWDAVAEVLRPSLSRIEAFAGEDWMALAERQYRIACADREKKRRDAVDREAVFIEQVRRSTGGPGDGPPVDGETWQDGLRKRGDGDLFQTPYNVRLLLRNHPDFAGCFRWNDVSKHVDVVAGPMLRWARAPIETLTAAVQDHLESAHKIVVSPEVVARRVIDIARENTYDPLRDHLLGLSWNGEPRISTWLKDYCGAKSQTGDYLEKVGRRWMIGLVARALQPGCKFDNVLILEGRGGMGKSTIFEILGGEWFCDTAVQLGDKDSRTMLARYWICELAELVAFKRTGHDSMKAFVSSRTDKFRPPWGKSWEDSPRRGVLVASTNDDNYFTDESGNRKYLPVACHYTAEATEALRRDRDQLLAEAVAAYRAGERWYFSYEEIPLTEAETGARMVETPARLKIQSWWFGLAKSERPRHGLTTLEIFEMAFDAPASQARDGILQSIGHGLSKMGFERRRDSTGARPWRHYATQELLDAEQVRTGRGGLFVVQGGKTKKDDDKNDGGKK